MYGAGRTTQCIVDSTCGFKKWALAKADLCTRCPIQLNVILALTWTRSAMPHVPPARTKILRRRSRDNPSPGAITFVLSPRLLQNKDTPRTWLRSWHALPYVFRKGVGSQRYGGSASTRAIDVVWQSGPYVRPP